MYIEIDFDSDEAIYMQLRNQIVLGIATNRYQEGSRSLRCASLQKVLALICIQ